LVENIDEFFIVHNFVHLFRFLYVAYPDTRTDFEPSYSDVLNGLLVWTSLLHIQFFVIIATLYCGI